MAGISHTSPAGLKVRELLNSVNKKLNKNATIARMGIGQYSINDKLWVNVNKWTYGNLVARKKKSKSLGRPKGSKTKKIKLPPTDAQLLSPLSLTDDELSRNVNFEEVEQEIHKMPDHDNIFESESGYNDRINDALHDLAGYGDFNRNIDRYSDINDY